MIYNLEQAREYLLSRGVSCDSRDGLRGGLVVDLLKNNYDEEDENGELYYTQATLNLIVNRIESGTDKYRKFIKLQKWTD